MVESVTHGVWRVKRCAGSQRDW